MRKSLKVSLAATILALTSACGAGGADLTAADGTSSPAKAAAAAAAADPLTQENFVERLTAAQLAAGSAHVEMDDGVDMRGDVRLAEDLEGTEARVTMGAGPMLMDLRVVDGIVYLKLGELSGGKFIRVDLNDPKDPVGQHFGSMAGQVDPTKQLKVFSDALVEFDDQGPGGEIDGVETTKLRLVLDASKALQDHEAGGPGLGAKAPKQLEYTLYVGSDDLLRRLTMDIAGSTKTMDWSKWGEPVEVKAPPADQVTDSSRLGDLGRLMEGSRKS
ncbi:hypothetical protein H1W00_05615 [Aeromicrobium sp. Marseille-Q0843]|uniref:LppX_LprAFG lipoprotein n=1 Tax=Aeromicrobium phoceense TaxID=2754045 RepID=A0A838XGP8_9ACTN|nr:hypothetical protein [Aeromicrobium phoceense]MBA4607948.1 hypothetical protein [Aeromicrobium phoceense]